MKPVYIILLILLASCTSLKKSTTKTLTTETSVSKISKIIFLNYKVSKDLNNKIEISLVDKIITEGSLKKNQRNKITNNLNNLICTQQDLNLVAIDSIFIANPLIKNIEYADDSGKLSRKTIELDSIITSIRMDLKPQTKFITLKLLSDTNNSLLKIQL
jgi:hypothetical protein